MSENPLQQSGSLDLLAVIIDPEKSASICCLCFNPSENYLILDEEFEFVFENGSKTDSLHNIFSYLLPTQEQILNQACYKCTEILLKFYKILKIREKKLNQLKKLTNNFINEANNISHSRNLQQKIMLYLTDKQEFKTNNSFEEKTSKVTKKLPNTKVPKVSPKSNNVETSLFSKTKSLDTRKHSKASKNQESYVTCHNCNRKFSSKKKLKSHINTHFTQTCPYCHKNVKNSIYHRHIKMHETGIQPNYRTNYKCTECGYKSTCKSSLEAHRYKVHLKIRPFVCTVCGKGFYKKSNLTEHERVHNKEKDLICEVCGQSFSNIKCLSQHIQIHSDVKEFKCDSCELRFKNLHRKREHMKSQHSAKSFPCTQCGKSYGLQKELNRHMKLSHLESNLVFGGSSMLDSKYFDNT